MPLTFQHQIRPEDLRDNPGYIFLFGDNELRQGRGGQAAVCRGQPNAVGVATKRTPKTTPDAYWSDKNYGRQVAMLEHDLAPAFAHVRRGGTVVCPSRGLGTGLSELPSRAPHTFTTLRQLIIDLKLLGEAEWPNAGPHILNKKTGGILPDAQYCGRPSPLGNPFVIGKDGSRADVIRKYDAWIQTTATSSVTGHGIERPGSRLLVLAAPMPLRCSAPIGQPKTLFAPKGRASNYR